MRSQLSKGRSPEAWLITAEHQHGVILRQQLIGAGVSSSAIDRMVQSGRVVVLHRGVYRVAGHHPTWFSAVMAATLVGGPGAVASHRSAARLWRLQAGVHEVVEITTKRRISPTRIAVHRGTVERTETTTIDRIPVTGIHRTLIDLGDVAD
ncbi:MAG: type IV toxin-antitoxin system AbiEi family antitoxin domain-containing protein, partial [Actinobacteria bacterium]|nr:type IV toxin-antitoxin system AbiEi family antitoxin domain-containing protein [Actinomycetota bacterium]